MADGEVDEADLDSLNLYEDVTAQEVEDFFKRVKADAVKDSLPDAAEQEDEEDDDGNSEPRWLQLDTVEILNEATDAETHAEYIESLPEDSDRPIADLEDVCTQLVQYLIGHPSGLVTKKRKFGKKGGKSRYFGEEKSEDVMADKFETGCWACGKLTHDSGDCPFKRCFVCSQQGHQHWECTLKTLWCKKCSAKGHVEEDCPQTVYTEGILKKQEDNDDYDDLFFCRCVSCREDGHLNCAPVPKAVISAPVRPPAAPLRAPAASTWGGPRPPAEPPWQQNAAIRPGRRMPQPPGVPPGSSIRPVAKWPAGAPLRPSSAPDLDQSATGGWKRPVAKWPAEPPQKRPRLGHGGGSEENWADGGAQASQQVGRWQSGSQNSNWGAHDKSSAGGGAGWNRGSGGSQNNGWGDSQGNGWNSSWANKQGRAPQGAKGWSGAQPQGGGCAGKGGWAKGGSRGAGQGGWQASRW